MPKPQQYLIGIDGGSQSTKVLVFDTEGGVITQVSIGLRDLHQPSPGVAEHPDDDLWTSLQQACSQLIKQLADIDYEILAIGLCSIRCCRAELDAKGELVSPVLNWKDQRLAKPYEPTHNTQSGNTARYVTTASGYLSYRLTGNTKDTASNYEGMWPIDKTTWQWSSDTNVYEHCGMSSDMLFELCQPGSILGKVSDEAARLTGLPAGVPVVATANDKAVEALGSGLVLNSDNRKTALISLGTYICGMVNGNPPATEVQANGSQHYFTNMSCIPGEYLYECTGVRNGMGIISWYRDLLGVGLSQEAAAQGCSSEALLDQEAAKLSLGSDGLICIPDWLSPTDQPFKRGAFIGLHNRHNRGHLHRALLEGIALAMNNNLNNMLTTLEQNVDQILLSGGGAKSDVFAQIFADVTGKNVHRQVVQDAAALGSAICAAVAVECYDSFNSAVSKMIQKQDTIEPNPQNHELYKQLNEHVFQNVCDHTDPILNKVHLLFSTN